MKSPYTRDDLITDFINLGLEKDDTVFIHSSFNSLGEVEGGANTVISALEDVIGAEGLILMPSFNLLPTLEDRVQTWNVDTTPSTVGWLTEFFRQMSGTYRSDNYSHSVAARGKGAEVFVADHLSTDGYQSRWDYPPWGKTYGTHSPMFRAYQTNGKLLMIGVDYHTSTYIHLVEVMYWNKRLTNDSDADFLSINRTVLGEFWDSIGILSRGKVGDSDCRLFEIKTYVDALLKEVEKNPKLYIT